MGLSNWLSVLQALNDLYTVKPGQMKRRDLFVDTEPQLYLLSS